MTIEWTLVDEVASFLTPNEEEFTNPQDRVSYRKKGKAWHITIPTGWNMNHQIGNEQLTSLAETTVRRLSLIDPKRKPRPVKRGHKNKKLRLANLILELHLTQYQFLEVFYHGHNLWTPPPRTAAEVDPTMLALNIHGEQEILAFNERRDDDNYDAISIFFDSLRYLTHRAYKIPLVHLVTWDDYFERHHNFPAV